MKTINEMEEEIIELILSLPLDNWHKNRSDAWETEINNTVIYIWPIQSGVPFHNKLVIDGVDFVVKEATYIEGKLNKKEAENKLNQKKEAIENVYNKLFTL